MFSNLKFAFRSILRQPRFSIAVIFLLGAGIILNTVAFTILNAVLIRPLPYPNPDQLITLWEENVQEGKFQSVVNPANYLDWSSRNTTFQKMAAYLKWNMNSAGSGEPERISVGLIHGPFFEVLQVPPLLGSTFNESQQDTDSVVLSHGFWMRYFGGDQKVLNKSVNLNGKKFLISGVMPSNFSFPDQDVQMWLRYDFAPEELTIRTGNYLRVIGRLKPQTNITSAQAELKNIATQLEKQYPDTNKGWNVRLIPMLEEQVGKMRSLLLILFGAVGMVLLISCSNAANLLLARATSRTKEFAVRGALGAGKSDLMQLMILEGLILSLAAGGLSLILVSVWINSVVALIPLAIPRINEIRVDTTVFAFTSGISLITGLLFSLVPAFFGMNTDLRSALESGGRATESGKVKSFRNVFVGFQIALAIVLLSGSLLFIQSMYNLYRVDPGFQLQNRMTFRLWLPTAKYPENAQQSSFFKTFLENLRSIPGVEDAAAIQDLPLRKNKMAFSIQIKGNPSAKGEENEIAYRTFSGNYFRLMGIPVLRGTVPSSYESSTTAPVVWINQAAADAFWPGEDAIGQSLKFAEEDRWLKVAGIVGDVKHMGLEEEEGPALYQPHSQKTFSFLSWMTVVVHTAPNDHAILPLIRTRLREQDPSQPIFEIATLEEVFNKSTERSRFSTSLLTAFAILAIILACSGIFSVVQYSVVQRTREIGIRMALGASQREIKRLLFKEGIFRLLAGALPGVVLSVYLSQFLRNTLFQVGSMELTAPVVSVVLIFFSVLAATYLPAKQAANTELVSALHYE
jgi:putative ABC transport system permease protein